MSATIPVVPEAPAQPAYTPGPYAEQPPLGQPTEAQWTAAQPTAPQPPAASATPTQWLSISSLVLGIGSIFAGWTFVMPVAGLVLGILALRREPASRTMAIWGVAVNGVVLLGGLLAGLGALLFGLIALPFAFLPFAMF